MDAVRVAVTACFAWVISNALAAPAVLWSIGQKDNSGKELGLERQFKRFQAEVPKDITFNAGVDAANKWPFIHPGPIDKWAGETSHPLTIRFNLPEVPRGQCALVFNTLGSYAGLTEKFRVVVNGEVTTLVAPRGPGDEPLYDETKAQPASARVEFYPELLKAGQNDIVVTVSDGAWVLYDNIQLETDESAKAERLTDFRIESTPCLTTSGKALAQVIKAHVTNRGPRLQAKVTGDSGLVATATELKFGENSFDLLVPAVDSKTTVAIALSTADANLKSSVAVSPQRKWKLFIQPSIHTDIGYTHRQEEVFHRHNTNLDRVIEMCRRNPLFRWSIEVAWEVQNYFADRPAAQQQELISLMQQGRLGLNAGYLNMLTALMSDEAMNHYTYYAAGLRRKYGIDISNALMTDIPSATRGLVAAMSGSGVRYFAEGCNEDRGPTITNSGIRAPFYWEGVDGSRVLTWLSQGYAQSAWMAHATDLDTMFENVAGVLRSHERKGDKYPFDAAYLYGAFLDNWEVDERYGALVKEWSQKYAYPEIVLSRGPEFFEYLEQNFADKIEVRKQDFGAYWEDGAGSTQQETTMHMGNQRRTTLAETLFSVARLGGSKAEYPAKRFRKVWEDIIFYAEHTWGAAQSISSPDDPMTIDQWKVKAEYARRPDKETRDLEKKAITALTASVPSNKWDVLVVNPSPYKRSGLVQLPLVTNGGHVQNTPLQREQVGPRVAQYTWLENMDAFATRVLQTTAQEPPAPQTFDVKLGVMENQYYRVEFSAAQGVTSIVDKETKAELLDKSSPYRFGQLLYAAGGEGTRMIHPDRGLFAKFDMSTATITAMSANQQGPAPKGTVVVSPASMIRGGDEPDQGPFWQEAVISYAAPSMMNIRTAVKLHEKEKRISVDVTITSKTEVRAKEAVYVAFPFAGSSPKFRLGMSNAIQRPDKDFSRGACHEWYCIQDFVSCANPQNNTEVVWTSPDAPLICLSEINKGRWIAEPELTTATIFSYALNNYWHTNYKAGQGGDFHFRYEITSGKAGISNEQCLRFARETAQPLVAVLSEGTTRAAEGAASGALSVEGEGVFLGTIKAAEDGNGTVVRLRNSEDTSTTARVTVQGRGASRAELLNLVEDSTSTPLLMKHGSFTVEMRPQQVATVRIYE